MDGDGISFASQFAQSLINVSKTLIHPWLSQSNYIISQLREPSHYEEYAIVKEVVFELILSKLSQPIPEGYLFLCPRKHFRVGLNLFRWPDCPAYWSLDPSGATRLSTEDARLLGFPSLEMKTTITVKSWDESVYTGLRQFQRAKGFDPFTQDAARYLGYPLYQLLTAHPSSSSPTSSSPSSLVLFVLQAVREPQGLTNDYTATVTGNPFKMAWAAAPVLVSGRQPAALLRYCPLSSSSSNLLKSSQPPSKPFEDPFKRRVRYQARRVPSGLQSHPYTHAPELRHPMHWTIPVRHANWWKIKI
ncbi:hypothetical protein MSAN_01985800 [Mycena sanguinolenta]|uniref:Uncharacterized protein n=1 Tax=Mycena sanguinolenta TaxID=230812 RepID=A0A8H6XN53_9AGAR|nr:hypothetical protein MSAN_01985800 [Mycena sanguinolenta]